MGAQTQTRARSDAYRLIERTLERYDYLHQDKAGKGILRRFLGEATGLSRAQVTRLLNQHRTTGCLTDHRGAPRRPFPRRYTVADVELLAEVDALHGEPSGPVARALCARACRLFGDRRFERLAGISNGHIHNLRHSPVYRRQRAATPALVVLPAHHGPRRPPSVAAPGHLRVVSLSRQTVAGGGTLYTLYLLDEVTQYRFVGCVEHLRAPCLAAVVDEVRRDLPFSLLGFHADKRSPETIREVTGLLRVLHADHLRRRGASEPVGNAAGHGKYRPPAAYLVSHYIPCGSTARVGTFNRQVLAPYLNYHRLSHFLPERCGIMTPYERLRSMPGAAGHLKSGVTFAQLDAVAAAMSDNESARSLHEEAARLFGCLPPPHRYSPRNRTAAPLAATTSPAATSA